MGRSVLALCALFSAAAISVSAQSVVSTHSGILYFFVGDVFLGDAQLEQKFGRFPDIEAGQELRTGVGRAEVLLTPGVFLRIDQNSSIRMLSTTFADTRVALVRGSAILEATEITPGTAVALAYQNWEIRVPQKGVLRIDTSPASVRPYQGDAVVSGKSGAAPVTVHEGETLPLADVLLAEPAKTPGNDDFKHWALLRSEAIATDNTVAAGIVDDPGQADSSGLAAGGYTYFPGGSVPSVDIGDPYGLSFWSPFQSTLTAVYLQQYFYSPVYLVWGGRQWPPARVIPHGAHGMPYSFGIGAPRVGPPLIGVPRIGTPRTAPPRIAPPRTAPPVYRPAPLRSAQPIIHGAAHR
ncbi:MAG TPA: hypothetical protein VFA04_21360 [Bryobacteraceae bacterium]|nr:hypothetical protein [Bryobacteraceae bacterium]